jgi:DNA end-binding protein Ku
MPRSIWKGAISFGLVNIPVALYSAESRRELRFNQLDRRTMTRVRERRVDEQTGREVPYEEIVRGYDTGGGNYVVLDDDDFRRANPKATQAIGIIGFVNADEIDITYFDKPYYLAPVGTGKKGYALLRAVLRDTGRVAIAKVVIRTREYLCAVIPRGEVMVLELLRFAYELREPSELEVPGDDLEALGLTQPEITMAEQLVAAMVTPWQPADYRDEYREDILRVIEEKQTHPGAVAPVATGGGTGEGQVVDIMALLRRSVEEARGADGEADVEAPAATGVAGGDAAAAGTARGAAGKGGAKKSPRPSRGGRRKAA